MEEELTKQQTEVLKILEKKPKLQAKTLETEYKTRYKKNIGNTSAVLNKLIQKGAIKRLDRGEYSITEEGKAKLQKKQIDITTAMFTKEEIEAFHKFSDQKDFTQEITQAFAPHLLGLEKEKIACLLSMISSTDQDNDRHRIHILYQGEPGSGKSSIIKTAYQKLWGFFADGDAKAAALTGTGSGYQTTSGLLAEADNSTVFIDEIDKMSRENQSALLGAMEAGFFTINKDKVIDRHVDARVRCIATCNNIERLREELVDRFDLIFDIKKLSKEQKTALLKLKINDWARPKQTETIPNFLKKYLQYAKTIKTTLPEDREQISKILTTELDTGSLEGKDVRKLEAAIRTTIAIAKLQLKNTADTEDCKKALKIMDMNS